jgi:osmotically-inducible protein OsmY
MANRNQDYSYHSGSRGRSQNWRDEDEGNDEGRSQYGQSRERDTEEQSGSTGRYAGYGDFGRGEYGGGRSGWSGQERYGQSGYGQGNYGTGQSGYGQSGYGRSGSSERDYSQGGGYGYGGGGMQRGRYGQSGQSGYGGSRSWSEPYGEGQQYGPGGEYGERGVGDDWGSQQARGYGSQGYDRSQQYGSRGYGGRGMGQHSGKGPKGYQRSDERTKELLCERLRDDPEIDPSDVTISVQGGKITLEGTVDSRQTKNAIEEIADQFGVQDVQNNLRIQRGQPGSQSSESQGRQARSASGEDNTGKQKHN